MIRCSGEEHTRTQQHNPSEPKEMLMILTSHQPVYLPWLGLFHKIALADTYCYFDVAQYLLKDWNNRNRIKTDQGPIWLSVPVHKKGYVEKSILEIEIDNDYKWGKKHWLTILFNYKKTPFFQMYADFFEDVYSREWRYLVDLNLHMLKHFLDLLNINVNVIRASDFHFEGKKSDQVLDMCLKLNADLFIFGEQGINYAIPEDFSKNGVKTLFQKYTHPTYPQLKGDFIPYLSVIDLLFNCGSERSYEIIMQGNMTRQEIVDLQTIQYN